MSFLVPQDISIRFLEGDPIPPFGPVSQNITRENALAYLKKVTGVDFGYDTVAWRKWFRENDPVTTQWFTLSTDEMNIAIIEKRPSMAIIGFNDAFGNAKEQARQRLIELTSQDFGYDGEAWRQWYRENRNDLAKRFVYG